MSHNIAIDGPAGAGKSTIAKIVAKTLAFIYVDTGAMYRAMALFMLRRGIDPSDSKKVSSECRNADITICHENGEQVVLLNGENVNGQIRTEEVGNMASSISVNSEVRKKLVELQQALARKTNVVMDGRDIGTVVLPDAQIKIYLTASAHVRALRRFRELQIRDEQCSVSEIEHDIEERDQRDMNREISPLKQAEDAILLDSSDMTIEQVAQAIIDLYQKK